MIILYTRPSCISSRKARSWLLEQGVPFYERPIGKDSYTEQEIRSILRLSENGVSDILSLKSKVLIEKKLNPEDLDHFTMNELIQLIISNPRLLKYPIMVGNSRLLVGFRIDEMGLFLPKAWRKAKRIQYYQSEKNVATVLGG